MIDAFSQGVRKNTMHLFEKTNYGFKVSVSGYFSLDAAKEWWQDYLVIIEQVKSHWGRDFGQFVDLRGFKPGDEEAQKYITSGMELFKKSGGGRSIVLFDSPIGAMQVKRLAKESGIYQWARFIDFQTHPTFEVVVEQWLVHGQDPDQ